MFCVLKKNIYIYTYPEGRTKLPLQIGVPPLLSLSLPLSSPLKPSFYSLGFILKQAPLHGIKMSTSYKLKRHFFLTMSTKVPQFCFAGSDWLTRDTGPSGCSLWCSLLRKVQIACPASSLGWAEGRDVVLRKIRVSVVDNEVADDV